MITRLYEDIFVNLAGYSIHKVPMRRARYTFHLFKATPNGYRYTAMWWLQQHSNIRSYGDKMVGIGKTIHCGGMVKMLMVVCLCVAQATVFTDP